MVDGGRDVDRGRPAVQRPGDGRPDHPGRRATRRCAAGVRLADVFARRRGGRRRRRRRPLVMTYWNPVERYGVDALRPRPRRGRRRRPDHAGPDPGRGRRLAGRRATRTTSTGSSWSRRRSTRRAASRRSPSACRGFVYAASTDGRHRRPHRRQRRGAEGLVARTRTLTRRCRSASGSASATAPRPPRSPVRRRRHRRFGVRPPAARRTHRAGGPGRGHGPDRRSRGRGSATDGL